MKKELLLGLFLSSATFQAVAEDDKPFYPSYYAGINLGSVKVAPGGGAQSFSYINVGFTFGYQFSKNFNAEFYGSLPTSAETDDFASFVFEQKVEVEQNVMGAYLVGKSTGRYYVKGRLGLARTRFTYSSNGYQDESEDKVGISYGIGFATEYKNKIFDLDYIVFPKVDDPLFDVDYDVKVVSLGVSWLY